MLTLSQLEQQLSKEIFMAYKEYKDIYGFTKVMTNEQILENGATLNISQSVSRLEVKDEMPKQSLEELLVEWEQNRGKLYTEIKNLIWWLFDKRSYICEMNIDYQQVVIWWLFDG